jgi:LuxR family maltose regulon positive regulatory protein
MLDRLDHANLFLIPLDDERRWYRYHHLFAQLLQARLQEIRPDLLNRLHARAARWFEERGYAAEAVRHALAAGAPGPAADLVERLIQRLSTWARVDIATFSQWLNRLPDEAVRARPWLQLFKSRALYLDGNIDAAYDVLGELEQSLENAEPTLIIADEIRTTIQGDRLSYATMRGEVRYSIKVATQMMEDLAPRGRFATVRPAMNLATAYLQAGDVRRAEQVCVSTIADAEAAELPFVAPTLTCGLALVEIAQGRLSRAHASCLGAMESLGDRGAAAAVLGRLRAILAEILYQRNDLASARQHAAEGLELIGRGWSPEGLVASYAWMAHIQQALGEPQEALTTIRQATEIAEQSGIHRIALIASAHQVRLWLAQGDLKEASRWAQRYRQVGETEYLREFEELTLTRVLLADEEFAGALSLLDALLLPAEEAGRVGHVIEILALQALALQGLGRTEDALQPLGRALHLAQPENYVRLFINAGEPMADLLRTVIHRGLALDYPVTLLEAFGEPREAWSPIDRRVDSHRTPAVLVDPLTDRELEVLALLAEDLSNREIAQQLYISLPTVKSHTSHIYQKLAVHSREEAVTRARALNLL